jgi:hypothetical protein
MRSTLRLDIGLLPSAVCFAVSDRSRDENSSSWALQAIVRPLPAPHRHLGSGNLAGMRALVLNGHQRSTSVWQNRRPGAYRRSGLGRRRQPALGSNPTSPDAEHPAHDARASGRFQEEGRLGTTMPVTRDSPSIQGDVPGPDPARAPPSKAVAGRGSLVGGSVHGASWVVDQGGSSRARICGQTCARLPSRVQRAIGRPRSSLSTGIWIRATAW